MRYFVTLSLILSSLLFAEKTPDYFSYSLEELLAVEISGASRRDENPNFAPGVISVVSAQEIERYGARHLRDVIDRLVGVHHIGSQLYNHNKTNLRAMSGSHLDNYVLILINGRPLRDAIEMGVNFDMYLGFPLNSIERIELIRGPGSVVYGTNALAGVVNVITKKADDYADQSRLDVSGGSYGRTQGQFSTLVGGKMADHEYSFHAAINSIRSEGDNIDGVKDSIGSVGTYQTGERSDNLFVEGHYRDVSIMAMVMDSHNDTTQSGFRFQTQPFDKKRYFLDVGYRFDIAEGWDAVLNYTLNAGNNEWQINPAAGKNSRNERAQEGEAIVRAKLSEETNVLLGLNYLNRQGEFLIGLPLTRYVTKRAYVQLDHHVTSWDKLILGSQWNKTEDTPSDVSSRFGYIHQYGNHWWSKLLYSEAFRSPGIVETSSDAPLLKGNPALEPEKAVTYDAQLIYQTSKEYMAIALYDTTLENLVVRYSSNPAYHRNEGSVRFQGIEVEGKFEVADAFDFLANASYQKNKKTNGLENSTSAPQIMVKAGISYDGYYGVVMSAHNTYVGTSTDNTIATGATVINPSASSYNLLTANLILDTAKLWNIGEKEHSFLSIYMDNILDEAIYTPSTNNNTVNTIPGNWGRGINITYSYRF